MLKEAIRLVRNYRNGNSRFVISGEEMTTNQCIDLVLAAAESTLPRTKMVEVWHCEYAARTGMGSAAVYTPLLSLYQSESQARQTAADIAHSPMYSCVRVTGPHQHLIPDDGAPSAAANPFDLKVCPWCSGPADFEEIGGKDGAGASFTVGCHDGDGSSVCFGYQSLTQFARKSDAAAAWNRRSGPNTQMLEALKETNEKVLSLSTTLDRASNSESIHQDTLVSASKALDAISDEIEAAITKAKGAAPAREPNSAESERPEGPYVGNDPPMSEG